MIEKPKLVDYFMFGTLTVLGLLLLFSIGMVIASIPFTVTLGIAVLPIVVIFLGYLILQSKWVRTHTFWDE